MIKSLMLSALKRYTIDRERHFEIPINFPRPYGRGFNLFQTSFALHLHDHVHIRSRERYNEKTGGRAAGMKGVYATKKRGNYEYIFTGEERDYRLYDGALYPMLGAMRFLVEQKPGEHVYSWKLKSFDNIKSFFDEIAPDLVATTYKTSLNYGRKPNPIGKDENHWDNMYKTVALHFYSKFSSK